MRHNVLVRPVVVIVLIRCATPMIALVLRHVDSLCLREILTASSNTLVRVGVVGDLIIRVPLNLLVEVCNALSSIEDGLADPSLSVRVDWDLELVTAHIVDRIHRLVACDWRLGDGLVQVVRVLSVLGEP